MSGPSNSDSAWSSQLVRQGPVRFGWRCRAERLRSGKASYASWLERRRIVIERFAPYQVRLASDIAQIVVEAAGAGIGPIDNFLQGTPYGLWLVGQLADRRKMLLEPARLLSG